jgi:hypothetical protein
MVPETVIVAIPVVDPTPDPVAVVSVATETTRSFAGLAPPRRVPLIRKEFPTAYPLPPYETVTIPAVYAPLPVVVIDNTAGSMFDD